MDTLINEIVFAFSVGLASAMLFVFEPYNWLMGKVLNFKPFNCVLCLSWYISAAALYALDMNLIFTFLSAFVGEFAYRKLVNE